MGLLRCLVLSACFLTCLPAARAEEKEKTGRYFGDIFFDMVHDTVDFAGEAVDRLISPHLPSLRRQDVVKEEQFDEDFSHDEDSSEENFSDEHHEMFRVPALGGLTQLFTFPFSMGREEWWKGPNVCVEQREEKEDAGEVAFPGIVTSFTFQSCSIEAVDRRTCIKKKMINGTSTVMETTYRCCHGYHRINLRTTGCVKATLSDVVDTLDEIPALMFSRLLKSDGLDDQLREKNVTIFAPTDNAIREFTEELEENNVVDSELDGDAEALRKRRETAPDLRDVILGHVIDGFVHADEMDDNTILETVAGSKIRMNVYKNEGMVTANCAPLISFNNEATNGLIHVIEDVLKPVTQSVEEILATDPRFSTFNDKIENLSLEEGQFYTVFAPTNEAFTALGVNILEDMDSAGGCMENLWKNHVVPGVLCSSSVTFSDRKENLLGQPLTLFRENVDAALLVEDATIVIKDIVATNGVIHVIDQVLIPMESLSLLPAVSRDPELSALMSMIRLVGMEDQLTTLTNVTLLAPTDAAFSRLPPQQLLKLQEDKERLRDILMYHVVEGDMDPTAISGRSTAVTSLYQDSQIHVRSYRDYNLPFPAIFLREEPWITKTIAQCVPLESEDHSLCNGRLLKVDKVLLPPTENVLDMIDRNEKFSIIRSLLELSGMATVLERSVPLTFLAPPDTAFNHLQVGDLNTLQNDKDMATKVIKHLIIEDVVCCTTATRGIGLRADMYQTLLGEVISFRRDRHDRVRVENAIVSRCDQMATNGILHEIDQIILPQGMPTSGGSGSGDILDRLFSILNPLA